MRSSLAVLTLMTLLTGGHAAAQDARLVSPDWPGAPALEHLARAGVLPGLDPLTRPWTRAAVVRALAAADTAALEPALARLVARLRGDLAEPDSSGYTIEAFAGALAASDAGRWALRPAGPVARLHPQGGVAIALRFPHLAVVSSPRFDNRLLYDPDYRGKQDRFIAGRNPEAYVRAAWPLAELFVGQVDRNWGPAGIEGLVLSPSPYTFDHFFVRLGPERFRLELLATQLDPRFNIDGTDERKRYLSLHRLVVRPAPRLTFSLFEAALYADASIERTFEPWYLNPANVFLLSQFDGVATSNALLGADVAYRGRGLDLAAQLYVDDFQVDDSTTADREPPGYGYTVTAGGPALRGRATWQALYTRVTNLAYRTPATEETYVVREVGIGRNWADYDQATLRLGWLARHNVLTGAELTWLRQGEGDMRLPYPAESLFAATPTIFAGTVERTVRLASRAEWWPRAGVRLGGELGVNLLSNAGHMAGASRSRWTWRVRAEVRRGWAGRVE